MVQKDYRSQRLLGRAYSVGLFLPIESYRDGVATMQGHVETVRRAELLGFKAIWLRDIPLFDKQVREAGQVYDIWSYLGYLAASTTTIVLGTASIVLPLRHPLHVTKAIASVHELSAGRLIVGMGSGDRPKEYAYFGSDFAKRGELFQERFEEVRDILDRGMRSGTLELYPNATSGLVPLLVAGYSRQRLQWIARHADGWMYHGVPVNEMKEVAAAWHREVAIFETEKPLITGASIDLSDHPSDDAVGIRNGTCIRLGREALIRTILCYREANVNHFVLSLRYCQRPAQEVMEEIGTEVLPHCL